MAQDEFNSDLSHDAWVSKYQHNNETLEEFFIRFASEFTRLNNFNQEVITSLPKEKLDALTPYGRRRLSFNIFDKFLSLFSNFKHIIPGGSVLSGAGSEKPVSLSNCYVVEAEDKISSIFDAGKDMAEIYKRRGGVGVDLSPIRPNKSFVNNASKTSSGVVPFMELYSTVTTTIGQDGRRGALMLSIDIMHPDSPEFIKIKQDLTKVTGANVSVKLTDEFMSAVENDEDYILRWPCIHIDNFDPKIIESAPYDELVQDDNVWNIEGTPQIGYVRRVKAKELWESVTHCAWNTAEPGILFWDNIINDDPASVYDQFRAISTNPCGEIPLSAYDSCRLIASNLYSLIKDPFTNKSTIDLQNAYEMFYEAQIIGDILVDLEAEAVQRIIDITDGSEQELWKKIKEIGLAGRRTGVGLMGLGDMLAAHDCPYNDYVLIEQIMQIKMEAELDATIDLAIINGPFPDYCIANEWSNYDETDTEPTVGKNKFYEFLRQAFPSQFQRMIQYGRRNISWSTIDYGGLT